MQTKKAGLANKFSYLRASTARDKTQVGEAKDLLITIHQSHHQYPGYQKNRLVFITIHPKRERRQGRISVLMASLTLEPLS